MRINFDRMASNDVIARCYELFQVARWVAMVTRCAHAFARSQTASDSSARELTLNANSESYVLIVPRVFAPAARAACVIDPSLGRARRSFKNRRTHAGRRLTEPHFGTYAPKVGAGVPGTGECVT
jgi:hypothetical protein